MPVATFPVNVMTPVLRLTPATVMVPASRPVVAVKPLSVERTQTWPLEKLMASVRLVSVMVVVEMPDVAMVPMAPPPLPYIACASRRLNVNMPESISALRMALTAPF